MELLTAIIKIGSIVLGIVFLVAFLVTDESKYGIWALLMGQLSERNN